MPFRAYPCLPVPTRAYPCLPVPTRAYPCLPVPTRTNPCQHTFHLSFIFEDLEGAVTKHISPLFESCFAFDLLVTIPFLSSSLYQWPKCILMI